jgi:peptidoglycan-N-acetylglucosamine deacetylase
MPQRQHQPIFFDPTKQRYRYSLRIAGILIVLVAVMLGAVLVAINIQPGMPQLGLQSAQERARHPAGPKGTIAAREARFAKAKQALQQNLQRSLPPLPERTNSRFERIAFFVNWDDNSWVSLKRNVGNIDSLIAEWLHLQSASGDVLVDDAKVQQKVLDFVHAQRPDLPVSVLINNFHDDHWDSTRLHDMLADPAARQHCIEGIVQFITTWQLAGVNIDFESLDNDSQENLVLFMQELSARLKPLGKQVSESVPVDDERFHFKELGAVTDYLMMMSYDENAADNPPGPIASQDWFINNLKRRLADIPASKMVVGIGNYGYDWASNKREGEELAFQDALSYAQDADDDLELDETSGNPHFSYDDDHDVKHQVWFLDAVTAFNQVQSANRLQPRGYALWRLGSEDPDVWQVLTRPGKLNEQTAKQLETLSFGYDLTYQGKGEILRVVGTPKPGSREVDYDPDIGLLTDDTIQQFPQGYVIQRWGFDNTKAIALTFDDGPDPDWTSQILDILRDKQAKATFFVIGENAEANPELIDRIYNEGHEIGNHTYTHPDIADVSDQRNTLELTTTERFLESRIGHRSLLFRPPYAEDVEPETPDQVKPLVLTSSLGYYSVSMEIDPDDWQRPPVDTIVQRVLTQAAAGDGNVVLLHDSGGDRRNTLLALPKIIDELRVRGYHFVTISQLLKLPRDTVMPPVVEGFNPGIWLENKGFTLVTTVGRVLRALFLAGIVLGVLRFVTIFVLSLLRRHARIPLAVEAPQVSVVVPAYNEGALIARTLNTLLSSQHVQLEIVVVDDGSTDNTAQLIREQFADEPRITLIQQANAGKAAALNTGISKAKHELIVALDADTLFTADTVAQLVKHFADPHIGAVAGNAKVGNRINLLTRWQALEYITSQNLDRRAFETLNCITVVPGAVGAWRRAAIEQAGGFLGDTLAEDADLTMRLVRTGYRIVYEPEAHAYTEAPQSVDAFVKQRFRWMYGTLQACWKQRDILFRVRSNLGMLALPQVIVFQIFFPLVSPVMDLTMLWTALETLFNFLQHPHEALSSGFWHTLYYYGVFLSLDVCTALIAYLFEPGEDWRLLPWLPLQRFYYRQLMYYVAIRSLVAALQGPYVGWGRLQRYGSVQTPH